MKILLIRHAHSEKNVEDRHGGVGRDLTEIGSNQLKKLSDYLVAELNITNPIIYYSNVTQAQITAEFLAKSFGVKIFTDKRIAPLNLGVLAGLSKQEAVMQYPDAAERLELWRIGKCKIMDLKIPQSESFYEFQSRGSKFLEEVTSASVGRTILIVGTRSILILLLNILFTGNKLLNEKYLVYEFKNGAVTFLEHTKDLEAQLVFHNNCTFLN